MRTFMLIAMLVVLPMQAQAGFWTGNKLVKHMREWDKSIVEDPDTNYYHAGEYEGFVIAAHDAFESARLTCPSNDVTQGQAQAIVAAFLKANAKRWNEDAISLVREALMGAFPCR